MFRLLALLLISFSGGCASLPEGARWGEDATYRPGWERIRLSAIDAARDPRVWIPAVGAGVLQLGDWDEEVSDWAVEHTPVFGSPRSADDWSDGLRAASILAYHASVLALPGGEDSWLQDKAKGYAVGISAAAVTALATQQLKSSIDRQRPNATDRESFPSGHASITAAFTRLTSRNLAWSGVGNGTQRTLDLGLDALNIATAWARVESGQHFPADALFGMALGNILAAVVNDAFLGTPDSASGLHIGAAADGTVIGWRIPF